MRRMAFRRQEQRPPVGTPRHEQFRPNRVPEGLRFRGRRDSAEACHSRSGRTERAEPCEAAAWLRRRLFRMVRGRTTARLHRVATDVCPARPLRRERRRQRSPQAATADGRGRQSDLVAARKPDRLRQPGRRLSRCLGHQARWKRGPETDARSQVRQRRLVARRPQDRLQGLRKLAGLAVSHEPRRKRKEEVHTSRHRRVDIGGTRRTSQPMGSASSSPTGVRGGSCSGSETCGTSRSSRETGALWRSRVHSSRTVTWSWGLPRRAECEG